MEQEPKFAQFVNDNGGVPSPGISTSGDYVSLSSIVFPNVHALNTATPVPGYPGTYRPVKSMANVFVLVLLSCTSWPERINNTQKGRAHNCK